MGYYIHRRLPSHGQPHVFPDKMRVIQQIQAETVKLAYHTLRRHMLPAI